MANYFVVFIAFKGAASPSNEVVERVLDNTVVDWLRFTRGQYVVFHRGDAEQIYKPVKVILDPMDSILVFEGNPLNPQGWVPQTTIDWLKKKRA